MRTYVCACVYACMCVCVCVHACACENSSAMHPVKSMFAGIIHICIHFYPLIQSYSPIGLQSSNGMGMHVPCGGGCIH